MLSVNKALQEILNTAEAVVTTTDISIDSALGRVLSEDHISPLDVPPKDNSAMDGYAINTQDLIQGRLNQNKQTLSISQRITAGDVPEPLKANTAARIFTGAEIPLGADAVVMQEHCHVTDNQVSIPINIEARNNIRPRAQDIKQGQVILKKQTILEPQHLGLLASIGATTVTVLQTVTVAILSTGDELVDPGEHLGPGQIYNSNRYLLKALLNKLGINIIDLGVVTDSLDATIECLQQAKQADCILCTGGVSVGEKDFVTTAVEQLGSLKLWRIAIKPGKPLAFGEIHGTPFFGLPGNPVSTFLTYLLFVRPYLLIRQGKPYRSPTPHQAIADFSCKANPKRQEYVRIILENNYAKRFHNQSSGVLSSFVNSNALAIVPINTSINVGDTIGVIPFSELF